MASLDLSVAFDLVNVELLIKRLKIICIPLDLIKLIRELLTDKKYYVQMGMSPSRSRHCLWDCLVCNLSTFFVFVFLRKLFQGTTLYIFFMLLPQVDL